MAAEETLLPGMPIEIIGDASEIIGKLQELYNEHGIYAKTRVFFVSHDDAGKEHLLRIDFDPGRGDGEYVLVPGND